MLGRLLDPIADKMLSSSALLLTAASGALWPWLAGLLLCRDIGVSGLRHIASQEGITIHVHKLGKIKTLAYDVALTCYLVNSPLWGLPFKEVGIIAIIITTVTSFYSAWLYFRDFFRKTKQKISLF